MVCLGEGNNAASVPTGYLQGPISTLHVTDEYLVELPHRLKYLLQVALGIVGVDNHRNPVCLIHRRKGTIKKGFFKRFCEKTGAFGLYFNKKW